MAPRIIRHSLSTLDNQEPDEAYRQPFDAKLNGRSGLDSSHGHTQAPHRKASAACHRHLRIL
jgi:hypothetical protein